MRWLTLFLLLFTPLFPQENDGDSQLYLSLNIDDGARLQLSNGETYEIMQPDRLYSKYWITPFPLLLSDSGDPDYPVKITNLNSGTSVRGRKIDTEAFFEREEEKEQRLEEQKRRQQSTEPVVPETQKPSSAQQQKPASGKPTAPQPKSPSQATPSVPPQAQTPKSSPSTTTPTTPNGQSEAQTPTGPPSPPPTLNGQSEAQTPTGPPSSTTPKNPPQKPKVKPSEDQAVSQQEHFNR